jgi:kynurenine formamidase
MNTEEDDEFERIEKESGWRKRQIQEQDERPMKCDGFDDCVIGVASIWRDQSTHEVLVYSGDAMVELLMKGDKMTDEEAIEYIAFNIEGAYIGVNTPVIAWKNEYWNEE